MVISIKNTLSEIDFSNSEQQPTLSKRPTSPSSVSSSASRNTSPVVPPDSVTKLHTTLLKMISQVDSSSICADFDKVLFKSGISDRIIKLEEENARLRNTVTTNSPALSRKNSLKHSAIDKSDELIKTYEARIKKLEQTLQETYNKMTSSTSSSSVEIISLKEQLSIYEKRLKEQDEVISSQQNKVKELEEEREIHYNDWKEKYEVLKRNEAAYAEKISNLEDSLMVERNKAIPPLTTGFDESEQQILELRNTVAAIEEDYQFSLTNFLVMLNSFISIVQAPTSSEIEDEEGSVGTHLVLDESVELEEDFTNFFEDVEEATLQKMNEGVVEVNEKNYKKIVTTILIGRQFDQHKNCNELSNSKLPEPQASLETKDPTN